MLATSPATPLAPCLTAALAGRLPALIDDAIGPNANSAADRGIRAIVDAMSYMTADSPAGALAQACAALGDADLLRDCDDDEAVATVARCERLILQVVRFLETHFGIDRDALGLDYFAPGYADYKLISGQLTASAD
ncbi:hypothetical protein BN1110_03715 [bacterium YEK0313]|nr:hypothetical protein BN1110_03715 [bacterium YEK0313]